MPSHTKAERRKRRVFKGSQKRLSRKVAIVRRESPSLTARQAVGKAAGILAHRNKKKRKRKR